MTMEQHMKTEMDKKKIYFPFVLTGLILAADQVTKFLINRYVPLYPGFPGYEVIGDFFRIIHVRNLGLAFSIGRSLPGQFRYILFILIPVAVMVLVLIYYFKAHDLTSLQRWAIAGILGGGPGNIIDRFFRPDGVIDFLDFRFYGIFGMERWPTFNVADSSVVVCGILLMISIIIQEGRRTSEQET